MPSELPARGVTVTIAGARNEAGEVPIVADTRTATRRLGNPLRKCRYRLRRTGPRRTQFERASPTDSRPVGLCVNAQNAR